MKNMIYENGEDVDVIRGVDLEHFHFKEKVLWVAELEILAVENSLLRRGDEIHREKVVYVVKDFQKEGIGFKRCTLKKM